VKWSGAVRVEMELMVVEVQRGGVSLRNRKYITELKEQIKENKGKWQDGYRLKLLRIKEVCLVQHLVQFGLADTV
jgi:hypothetical protein